MTHLFFSWPSVGQSLVALLMLFASCQEPATTAPLPEVVVQLPAEETLDYFTSETDTLRADLYRCGAPDRPLLIYIHGGGFYSGARNEPHLQEFCRALSQKNYNVASIDYSLFLKGEKFDCDQPVLRKLEALKHASTDILQAASFFIEQQNVLGITTDKIILLGSSAGAEAACWVCFSDEKCVEGVEIPLPKNFKFSGLVSMAGAVTDTLLMTKANALPTLLFHGTCDPLVPYGHAIHHYCEPTDVGALDLYGSFPIYQRSKQVGMTCRLVTGCGLGHVMAALPLTEHFDHVVNFIQEEVERKLSDSFHLIIPGDEPCSEYPIHCSDF